MGLFTKPIDCQDLSRVELYYTFRNCLVVYLQSEIRGTIKNMGDSLDIESSSISRLKKLSIVEMVPKYMIINNLVRLAGMRHKWLKILLKSTTLWGKEPKFLVYNLFIAKNSCFGVSNRFIL